MSWVSFSTEAGGGGKSSAELLLGATGETLPDECWNARGGDTEASCEDCPRGDIDASWEGTIGGSLDVLRLGGTGSETGESESAVTTASGPAASDGQTDGGGNWTWKETDGFGID